MLQDMHISENLVLDTLQLQDAKTDEDYAEGFLTF